MGYVIQIPKTAKGKNYQQNNLRASVLPIEIDTKKNKFFIFF